MNVTGCKLHRESCRHRGAVLREQNCPSCRGQVRLKVFGCAVHKECTLVGALPEVACCATCPDFAPTPISPESETG